MPDHLHGILYVHERIACHLGVVINGFKKACNDAFRELILGEGDFCEPEARNTPTAAGLTAETASRLGYCVPGARNVGARNGKARTMLWEAGYTDGILQGRNQLQAWINYLDDNPRRLWIKRHHREWFTASVEEAVGGETVSMMGNRFLLAKPCRVAVRCSRSLDEGGVASAVKRFMALAEAGAVLISPCISPGEKAVARAAFEGGFPMIIVLAGGIAAGGKPTGRLFDACSDGRLLVVWQAAPHNDRRSVTREQCEHMNRLAECLAGCDC